ncbi:hypothetical protein, partial [Sinorhizobium meliloti]|uniref:hypothetical protein n=1 Tax=Rhizobium meliloti TaxID=382 RepID=UPI0012FDDD75
LKHLFCRQLTARYKVTDQRASFTLFAAVQLYCGYGFHLPGRGIGVFSNIVDYPATTMLNPTMLLAFLLCKAMVWSVLRVGFPVLIKSACQFSIKLFLIAFNGQQVVNFFLENRCGNFFLATHGIDSD